MGGPNSQPDHDRALLVAMPLRHLEAARTVCDQLGSAILPAGGPGDLDETPPSTPVLVIATEAGEAEVPAATWRGLFVGRVPHEPADPWPEGLPATWIDEHPTPARPGPATSRTADPSAVGHPADEEEDEEEDDGRGIGPQSFFEVRALAPSPHAEWVYANELVPKQQRGGRTFLPRMPRLIDFID